MNKQFLRHIAFAALLSLPVIGGCKPADTPPSTPAGTNAAAKSSPIATPAPGVPTNGPAAMSAVAPAESVQPEVPFAVDRPIPENLSVSPPLREVIKLAQAGVDGEVLLTFVNNATSGFHLGADEIIYLTDIGVPSTVISTMMERDKILKAANAAAASKMVPAPAATATATQVVAAVPTYVQEPEVAATEPAEATVTETQFTDSLSPYGTWIDVEGYGRCWQPTVVVVNRNWRPYCDGGRWVYTDAGWYWYSDYSWGWAPFHYGRWFSHPRWGWCWYPGYTWGPAWVTWSYTDTYCGWAPLPPAAVYTGFGFTYYGSSVSVGFGFGLGYSCYSYVPWNHFCDYRPWRYCAPRPHCKDIHEHAVCHNDFATDRNHRVVNRGLPPERVSAYSRTEIRRVGLREVADIRASTGRREELTRDGRTLEIRRPMPANSATIARGDHGRTTPASDRVVGAASIQQNASASRNGNGAHATPTPSAIHSPETVGQAVPQKQPAGGHTVTPTRPTRSGAARPLVVIGNGDGRPPTPSTWTPSLQTAPEPNRQEELASASPSEVERPQTQPGTPPARPEVNTPARSQIIRVGRGIEDRPAGSPNYRVYSSPQRVAPSAPSYGPPPVESTPAASRPNYSTPSRAEGNDNGSSFQSPRPPVYESPRQAEQRPAEHIAPQRPSQPESRPSQAETRSAPSRSESSRSDNKSDSRPSQSDSGRGSRNR